jgi:2-polyprenyl-3-methyl-5-hydroxy-6-metoxy-1,4-benzoquinol methylase
MSPSGASAIDATSAPFAFGDNWKRFLTSVDEARVSQAEISLQRLLQIESLADCRFLDAGSGSGLFSLAASRLGAAVVSLDVDADSVACAKELKRRHGGGSAQWEIFRGSLLEKEWLESLGQFDIVYCWGVAHHTSNMWTAIDSLCSLVAVEGTIALAIYNDQLYISRGWRAVKQIYQRLPRFLRPVYVALIGLVNFGTRLTSTFLASALRLCTFRNPFVPFLNWAGETRGRGMNGWHDLVDWVGGWPYEVARPEEVFRFLRDRGFVLKEMTTAMGHGCNEFVFSRVV